MCGRYTLTVNADILVNRFKVREYQGEYQPRYNIAPTQNNPVVLLNDKGQRIMVPMKWGLIPFWAKEEKIGYKMINARLETVAEKPSFKRAFFSRRCLVPADGYYEWQKIGSPGRKPPFRVVLKTGELFAFAGLYDAWKNPEGEIIHSYTIITTEADRLIAKIHTRMPVILRPENEDKWIDIKPQEKDFLLKILKPVPSRLTEMYEVSPQVNRANIDIAGLIQPVR